MGKQKTGNRHLVLTLLARFREVSFRERYIPDREGAQILGEYDDDKGEITINPVPHTVDTLIHELIHLVYPNYSERAVLSLTGKVMKQLSEADLLAIYKEYRRKVEEDE